MTISEAAKLKACELANTAGGTNGPFALKPHDVTHHGVLLALARYIQQVSDALRDFNGQASTDPALKAFILPDPVDPLLIEARKAANDWMIPVDDTTVQVIAWALKRGIELERANHPKSLTVRMSDIGESNK